MSAVRVLLSGVAAAVAWWGGIVLVFGPAQSILADPGRQSAKFLSAFSEPPLPRMAEAPQPFALGLLLIRLKKTTKPPATLACRPSKGIRQDRSSILCGPSECLAPIAPRG